MQSPIKPWPDSVLNAPRRGHSEKPTEIYDIIESMYPNRRYLEVFAREEHPGWKAWGAEAKKESVYGGLQAEPRFLGAGSGAE